MKISITSYEEAQEYLSKKRAPYTSSRRLADNKWIVKQTNGDIAIQLYQTHIVTFHADKTISVNNGGWPTRTTHRHINLHLPAPYNVCSSQFSTVYWKSGEKNFVKVEGETLLK